MYSLDGNAKHAKLLSSVLPQSAISSSLVVVVVDMSRPWTIMDSLAKWIGVIESYLAKFSDTPEVAEGKTKGDDLCCHYIHPLIDVVAMAAQGIVGKDGDDTVLSSLDPANPSTNIGLPIIIVPAKVIKWHNLCHLMFAV